MMRTEKNGREKIIKEKNKDDSSVLKKHRGPQIERSTECQQEKWKICLPEFDAVTILMLKREKSFDLDAMNILLQVAQKFSAWPLGMKSECSPGTHLAL